MDTHPILITGVSRGIGQALAAILTDRGTRVIGGARHPHTAPYPVLPLDLSDDDSIGKFADSITGPIDILINNAGAATLNPQTGRVEDDFANLTRREFAHIFETNVIGTFLLTRTLLPHLRSGQRKIILNLSSNLGSIARNDTGGRYAYRCSKTALNMLTKTLAVDLAGEGFTCIAWNPGWVKTDMGGADADLTAEQSASALADFLPQISPANNGAFLDYQGAPIPW